MIIGMLGYLDAQQRRSQVSLPKSQDWQAVSDLVSGIVQQANQMKAAHTEGAASKVSYCAIFTHSDDEFNSLNEVIARKGSLAEQTATGPVYVVPPINTEAGALEIVKVRKPDPTRTQRGDADFALVDYETFKSRYLSQPGFKLIERAEFEMIELMDSAFNARAYFSHPPVEEHTHIKEALQSRKPDSRTT
jgi:hypothetical protein